MNCWLLMLRLPQVVDVVRNFFKAEAAVVFLDGVVVLAVAVLPDLDGWGAADCVHTCQAGIFCPINFTQLDSSLGMDCCVFPIEYEVLAALGVVCEGDHPRLMTIKHLSLDVAGRQFHHITLV